MFAKHSLSSSSDETSRPIAIPVRPTAIADEGIVLDFRNRTGRHIFTRQEPSGTRVCGRSVARLSKRVLLGARY